MPIAFILLITTYLLLSLPALLSTKMGTKLLLSYFNKKIPGQLSVEELSFSWFGPQTIAGFSLKDKDGLTILHFDALSVESHLINLIQKDPFVKSVDLKGLHAKISEDYPKLTNIHLSLGVKKMPFGLNRDKVEIHLPFAKKIALKKSKNPLDFTPKKMIVFNDVSLSYQLHSPFQPLSVKLFGKTEQDELQGHFDLNLSLVGLKSDNLKFQRNSELHLSSNVVNFPVDLLDLIFTSKSDPSVRGFLRDALGDRISLKIDQILTKENTSFEVTTESPTLNASMHAELIDNKISLQDRGLLTFTFTPELFERFASQNKNTPFLRMVAPTKSTLVIESLSLPLFTGDEREFPWDMKALSFDASLDLEDAQFTGSPFWGDLAIRGVRSTIEASENGEQAEWHLRGEAHQNGHPLQIRLDASLKKPNTFEDFLERLKTESQFQFEIAGVPLVDASKPPFIRGIISPPYCHVTLFDDPKDGNVTLDLALGLKGLKELSLSMTSLNIEAFCKTFNLPEIFEQKSVALFGKTLHGRVSTILNKTTGPFKGEFSGEHALLTFNGQLKNGVFTLKKPLKAYFDITPELTKEVLAELMPVFSHVTDADNRLLLSIEPKGFSLPLFPFRPYFGKIDNGCLEMGQVSFKRSGEIASLIELLDTESKPEVPVSFSPIHFKIKSGVIQIERTNILFLDQFALATWGKIDLVKDKVQMTLGVSGEALKRAFHVEGLDNDFVLQLPIKGHLSEAKVDRSKALLELSALVGKEF